MSILRCDCLFLGREAERRVCCNHQHRRRSQWQHAECNDTSAHENRFQGDQEDGIRRNSASRDQMEEFQQIRAGAGDSTSRGIQAQRGPEQAGCCM